MARVLLKSVAPGLLGLTLLTTQALASMCLPGEGGPPTARYVAENKSSWFRDAVLAGVGEIPEAGGILQGLVGALWGEDSEASAVFDQMKAYVDTLVPELIAQERARNLENSLAGLKGVLRNYKKTSYGTKEKHDHFSDLIDQLIAAEPFFFDERNPEKTLPYFVQMGTLMLFALRDQYTDYKKIYNTTEDKDNAQHLADLKDAIKKYTAALEQARTAAMAWRFSKVKYVSEDPKEFGDGRTKWAAWDDLCSWSVTRSAIFRTDRDVDNSVFWRVKGEVERRFQERQSWVRSSYGADLDLLMEPATLWPYLDPTNPDKPPVRLGAFSLVKKPLDEAFARMAANPAVKIVFGDFQGEGLTGIALVGEIPNKWPIKNLPGANFKHDGSLELWTDSMNPYWYQFFERFHAFAQSPGAQVVAGRFSDSGRDSIAIIGGQGWTQIPIALAISYKGVRVTNPSDFEFYFQEQGNSGSADVRGSPTIPLPADFNAWARLPGVKAVVGRFDDSGRDAIALIGGPLKTIPIAFHTGQGGWRITNQPFPWLIGPGIQLLHGDFMGNGRTSFVLTGVAALNRILTAVPSGTGDGSFVPFASDNRSFVDASAAPGVQAVAGRFDDSGRASIALLGGEGWGSMPVAHSNGDGQYTVTNFESAGATEFHAALRSGKEDGFKVVVGRFSDVNRDSIALIGLKWQRSPWDSIPVAFADGKGKFVFTNEVNRSLRWSFNDVALAARAVAVGHFANTGAGAIALMGGPNWNNILVAFAAFTGQKIIDGK